MGSLCTEGTRQEPDRAAFQETLISVPIGSTLWLPWELSSQSPSAHSHWLGAWL